MARKPNYQFERRERERVKSAKKAAREQAKRDRADARKQGDELSPADSGEIPGDDNDETVAKDDPIDC